MLDQITKNVALGFYLAAGLALASLAVIGVGVGTRNFLLPRYLGEGVSNRGLSESS